MALAQVTGTLNDCGLGHLIGKAPQLLFSINDVATSPAGLFVTEPIQATLASDGTWTIGLEPTETMHQFRYYTLQAIWLDSAANYVKVDFPGWRIFVPIAGGALPNIIDNFTPNPYMVIFQATQPDPWPIGSVWVDTSVDTPTSGDLNRRKA